MAGSEAAPKPRSSEAFSVSGPDASLIRTALGKTRKFISGLATSARQEVQVATVIPVVTRTLFTVEKRSPSRPARVPQETPKQDGSRRSSSGDKGKGEPMTREEYEREHGR